MNLNTVIFYLVFLLISVIYFFIPLQKRWIWLLISSWAMIAWADSRALAVLGGVALITYLGGLWLGENQGGRKKVIRLWSGIGAVLLALLIFKYQPFLGKMIGENSSGLFFPLGISFYSFQAVSYMVDIRRKTILPEKNFFLLSLYLAYFPKIISGPIERAGDLLPQLQDPEPFDSQRTLAGIQRVLWGVLKKLIIADRLAVVVGTVFSKFADLPAPKIALGILFFSLQVYIDFSAYCDIALGLSSILGIRLTENFQRPYFARSVVDFWRGWHISLSTWLRDYIFLPLNFSTRRSSFAWMMSLNILFTFIISGIWHGAAITFVVWGTLHGLYQAVELILQPWRRKMDERIKEGLEKVIWESGQVLCTFLLVTFAWVFFRSVTLRDAFGMLRIMGSLDGSSALASWQFYDLGLDRADFWVAVIGAAGFMIWDYLSNRVDLGAKLLNSSPAVRWLVYFLLILVLILFGYYGDTQPQDFIYMRF